MCIGGRNFRLCVFRRSTGEKGLASRWPNAGDGLRILPYSNLYKLYLIVDKENEKAIHIYRKLGF